MTRIRQIIGVIAVGFAATLSVQADGYWMGLGSTLNWSDGNWAVALPSSSGVSWFEDTLYTTGFTNVSGAVNNIVDTTTSVGALYYNCFCQAPNTTSAPNPYYHFSTTLIPAGNTLTVGGLGATATTLAVGDVPSQGPSSYRIALGFPWAGYTNYTTMTGGGNLVVNDSAGVVSVGGGFKTALDISGLNNFTANVGKILVGASSDNNTTTSSALDSLFLARTNTLITAANPSAPGILLGSNPGRTSAGVVFLGQTNFFGTDGLVVGGRRANSGTFLGFAGAYSNTPAMGRFTLRGSAGNNGVSVFSVGDLSAEPDDYNAFPTGTTSTSTADFSGGVVDILADSIYIGRSTPSFTTNTSTLTSMGILLVENGTVTATNVYIANKATATNNSAGSGLLVLRSNATMTVLKDLSLCFRTNGSSPITSAQLVVSNSATLNVGGNISCTNTVASGAPASIKLADNAVINMTGGGSVNVPSLSGAGYLTNASSILVTNALALGNVAVPLVAATLHVGKDLILSNGLPLSFKLGADNTVGGGISDYLDVARNITFSTNRLNLTFNAPLVVGNYKLITYGGTQTGSVTWTNPARFPITLVQGSGSVGLSLASLAPGNLTWAGTNSAAAQPWDSSTTNWNGNTDKFFAFDNVVFDDTGAATNVNIGAITNMPSSVTFNNTNKNYTLSQTVSGALGGFASLTKNGPGLLVIGSSSGGFANYFTGPINLNQGILQIGAFNTAILGSSASTNAITIASGAMLDLNGNPVGQGAAWGRYVNVAGTGVNGFGAIANNSASSVSMFTRDINLTADTTFGASNNASLTIAGAVAPYQSVLNLNGHTLTTVSAGGLGSVQLNQLTITNSGSITVNSRSLGLNSVILDGPGTINLGNKVLNFYNAMTTGYVAKAISVSGGAISTASPFSATLQLLSPISIASGTTLSITNVQPILASGVISGANSSLIKYGNSNLIMSAANTYSGSTEVAVGRLVLTNGGSLASSLVQVDAGASFDVTPLSNYTIPSGQTLTLIGPVYGDVTASGGSSLSGFGTNNGSVTVSAGANIVPGTALVAATLTVTNDLTFNGGTNFFKLAGTTNVGGGVNDLVTVGGNLSFTAPTTIRIQPVASLDPVNPYTLFTYSGTLSGLSNVTVTTDSRYTFVLDSVSVPGSVLVTIGGSAAALWWHGGDVDPTLWDVTGMFNWRNGGPTGTADSFFNGDSVTFDDSSVTNLVRIDDLVKPAAMTNDSTGVCTLYGSGNLLAGTLVANSGTFVLANTNNNLFNGAGLVFNGGSIAFNQPNDASVTVKLSGGAGSLNKNGANTLTFASPDSSTMSAAVNVNAGTLKPAGSNTFGNATLTVASGGTFDVNGQVAKTLNVHIAGNGADGLGAINNRSFTQTSAFSSLTLDGDATVGAASNRWDLVPTGTLQGNLHNLSKVGAADIWLTATGGSGMGNIDVLGGRLIMGGVGSDLGDVTVTAVTVHTNATFGVAYGMQGGAKPIVVQAGGSLYSASGTNRLDGQVTLTNGVVILDVSAGLNFGGDIKGPGTLNVRGNTAGNLGFVTLEGHNIYSGGTLVNDGTLIISNSFSLPANTNVTLNSRVAYTQTSGHPIISLATNVTTPASVLLDMETYGPAGPAQAGLDGNGGTWAGPIKMVGTNLNCVANFTASGVGGLVVAGAVNGSLFTGNLNTGGNGGVRVGGDNVLISDASLGGTGVRFNNPLVFPGSLVCNNTGSGSNLGTNGMTKLVLASGGNSWTDMTWNRGVIQLGADNALPLVTIRIGNSSGDHRTILDLNGHTQTLSNWLESSVGQDASWMGNSSTSANATLVYAGGTGTNTWTAWIVDSFDTNAPVQKQTALNVTSGYLKLVPYPFGEPATTNISYFRSGPPPYPMGNTYTGPTTVTGGTLEIDRTNVPGPAVSPITVSGTGTLAGAGIIGGSVTIASGGTLAPGTNAIGTNFIRSLTVSNNVTLQAGGKARFKVNLTTGTNDQVVGISTLTYGGTLTLTNIGAQAYTNGTVIKLFDAATYAAGPVTIQPASPGNGLMWDSTQLAVDGTLRVVPVVTPVVAAPVKLADKNISFTITGGIGQGYTVRATTNVTLPLTNWSVLQSGSLPSAPYTFTDLTATNYPQRYYRVSTP
jgi:autotransporter-associated beta strand protein